jgi:hypothetical protein
MKQTFKDLKEDTDCNIIMAMGLSTPLSLVDSLFKQKINKKTLDLINTLNQMDLTDMHRHSTQQEQNTHCF